MTQQEKNGAGGIVAKLGAFLSVAIAALLVSHFTHVGEYFSEEKLQQVARQLGAWGPLVIIGLGIVTPLAFLPRWPLAFLSGMLYGLTQGTLLATFASTLGAMLNFYLSLSLLAPMTERLKAKYHLERLHVPRDKEFMFIFLMRAFPLSNFVLTNLIAGALKMRPNRYLIASFLGMLPSSLMYAAAGKLMKKPDAKFYYAAAGILAIFVGGAWLAQKYVQPWMRELRGGKDEPS
jgi:uncharacterized membrane protein YdjX (TVP38/TMEM64 family)